MFSCFYTCCSLFVWILIKDIWVFCVIMQLFTVPSTGASSIVLTWISFLFNLTDINFATWCEMTFCLWFVSLFRFTFGVKWALSATSRNEQTKKQAQTVLQRQITSESSHMHLFVKTGINCWTSALFTFREREVNDSYLWHNTSHNLNCEQIHGWQFSLSQSCLEYFGTGLRMWIMHSLTLKSPLSLKKKERKKENTQLN